MDLRYWDSYKYDELRNNRKRYGGENVEVLLYGFTPSKILLLHRSVQITETAEEK